MNELTNQFGCKGTKLFSNACVVSAYFYKNTLVSNVLSLKYTLKD